MNVLYSKRTNTTYENFIAYCPYCNNKNIFNRISDLETTHPIDFKEVLCFNCKEKFNINCDSASLPFRKLIFDCYELCEKKEYRYCILNLTQAFESFFNYYLYIKYLYLPAKNKILDSTEELNSVSLLISNAIKNMSYFNLRNLFLNLMISKQEVNSVENIIDYISNIETMINEPTNAKIDENMELSVELRNFLRRLKKFDINVIRNKVVHKLAFRPSHQEVEYYFQNSKEILFGLSNLLNIRHDIYYLNS